MAVEPLSPKEKDQDIHIKSLREAVRVLDHRVRSLEMQNRSLDALVRRTTGEALRATQLAQKANNEIAQIHNMLSRRG